MQQLIIGLIAAIAATLTIIILTVSALTRIRFMHRHDIHALRKFYIRRSHG